MYKRNGLLIALAVLGVSSVFAASASAAEQNEDALVASPYVTEVDADSIAKFEQKQSRNVIEIAQLSGKTSNLVGAALITGASPTGISCVKEYGKNSSSLFHVADPFAASDLAKSVVKNYEKKFEPDSWDGKFNKEHWNHRNEGGYRMRFDDFRAFVKEYGLFGMTKSELISYLGVPDFSQAAEMQDKGSSIVGYSLVTWWCGNAYRGVEILFDFSRHVSKYRFTEAFSRGPWIQRAEKTILIDPRCTR